jgi:hypothetical protein
VQTRARSRSMIRPLQGSSGKSRAFPFKTCQSPRRSVQEGEFNRLIEAANRTFCRIWSSSASSIDAATGHERLANDLFQTLCHLSVHLRRRMQPAGWSNDGRQAEMSLRSFDTARAGVVPATHISNLICRAGSGTCPFAMNANR